MNSFLFSLVILVTFNTYAFDSKVTFSIEDMKKNNLVVGASGGNKAETCDSGFAARNIPENPRTPDDAIIGDDTYKICIKDSGNGSSETPAPNSRSSR